MRDAEAAKYDGLIQGALEGSVPRVVATCEPRGTLRVERGAAYALLLLPEEGWPEWTGDEIEDLLVVSPARLAKGVRFEDAEGHRRPVYAPMLFYARFFLHSIPEDVQRTLMTTISEVARPGDYFAAEFRTDKDAAIEKVHGNHYRRFQNGPAFGRSLQESYGFVPLLEQEGNGFSPYKGEDPQLYRVIARRES